MSKLCTASGTISAGDAVAVVGYDVGTYPTRPFLVARATAANLPSSRAVLGISRESKTDTQQVDVYVSGDIAENGITGLGAGESRLVVTDFSNATASLTCKLKRIDDFDPGVDPPVRDLYVVGTCDEEGNVTILPRHHSEQLGYRRAFSIQAYGAVPDGTTPCDDAFAKMFAAMQATATTDSGAATSLGLVELGQGSYYFEKNLVLMGNCVLQGVTNTMGGESGSTQLQFAPGKQIVVPFQQDSRFGRPTGITIRDMAIVCAPYEAPAKVPTVWAPDTEYQLGDLVYLPHSREYIYECIKAGDGNDGGQSQDTPAWAPMTHYDTNDVVTPSDANFNGHQYKLISDPDDSGATDPFDPDDYPWKHLDTTEDGDLVWQENGIWEGFALASDIAVCIGVPSTDPSVRWTAASPYNIGDVIFVDDGDGGIRTDAVWVLLEADQATGGISGAGPGGGWDPVAGHKTTDGMGGLVWTALDPENYFFVDNECVWVPRIHGAVHSRTSLTLENLRMSGAMTAKVHIRSNEVPPLGNANDWRATNLQLQGGDASTTPLGPGFVVAGNNSNAGVANGIVVTGSTSLPGLEWDYGFREGSSAGCTWIGCHVEQCGGYGFVSNSYGQPSFLGCYLEGGQGVFIPRGVIVGGSLAANPGLSEESYAVVLAGQQSLNVYTDVGNPFDPPPTPPDPPANSLRTAIGPASLPLRSIYPLAFWATGEGKPSGWGWSTEMVRRGMAYQVDEAPGREGWWVFGYNVDEQGTLHSSFATSGILAEPMRDFPVDTAGMFWVTKDHLFFGFGNTPPMCIKRADDTPADGDWIQGDRIWNKEPITSGYAGWICTDPGNPGTWTEYGRLASSEAELSLAANFTTTSTSATSTNLAFPIRAGETWILEFDGIMQCSSTGGCAYAIGAPGGTTVTGWLDSTTSGINSRSVEQITVPNSLTTTAVHTVATTPTTDRLVATVTAVADGNITIQAASVTSMQTTTIFAGATLRARRAATA